MKSSTRSPWTVATVMTVWTQRSLSRSSSVTRVRHVHLSFQPAIVAAIRYLTTLSSLRLSLSTSIATHLSKKKYLRSIMQNSGIWRSSTNSCSNASTPNDSTSLQVTLIPSTYRLQENPTKLSSQGFSEIVLDKSFYEKWVYIHARSYAQLVWGHEKAIRTLYREHTVTIRSPLAQRATLYGITMAIPFHSNSRELARKPTTITPRYYPRTRS